jgi:D-3-phosphoglycerate dehydrogenase / 2-oxoglutarate reductase
MYKIQTLNKIASIGLDLFPRDNYEIASEIMYPDAIIVRSQAMHDLDLPPSLLSIARAGAGVNNIPVDKCSGKGIVVFNTPGANANGVKELTLAAMFVSARSLLKASTWVTGLAGKGHDIAKAIEKGKADFVGPELRGKKLGVIGLGAIGVMVANDAMALGMEVSGYDPYISVEAAWNLARNVKRALSLDALIADSDYLTLHLPLMDKTKGMINRDKFNLMKKGVRIMNFARGGLVNNADLKAALANGSVAAYATDFADEDLLKEEKVIAFPHLGASTPEAEDNCAVMAVNQTRNFLEFGNIRNSVNFPECDLPPAGKKRLIVGNKNVPNMVGQITTVLAQDKINIADMLNKSKAELAYNIIDIDGNISQKDVEKIRKIDGVIMARLIE